MKDEFAIVDNNGVFFGLPAKTFVSQQAAQDVLDYLGKRRDEMHQEALQAESQLRGPFKRKNIAEAHARDLEEAVARWKAEEPRSYRIVVRPVGEWEAVA